MEVKISGAIECLFDAQYEAEVVIDTWTPENIIWIVSPTWRINPPNGNISYEKHIKILTAPENAKYADEVAKAHNEIHNSPLAKAMREEE